MNVQKLGDKIKITGQIVEDIEVEPQAWQYLVYIVHKNKLMPLVTSKAFIENATDEEWEDMDQKAYKASKRD